MKGTEPTIPATEFLGNSKYPPTSSNLLEHDLNSFHLTRIEIL
jgi:hypothetical protein